MKKKTFSREECKFNYRDSFFKTTEGKEWIVLSVTFLLSKKAHPRIEYKDLALKFLSDASPSLQDIRNAVIEIRGGKFPNWKEVGTAGSFFKNPIINLSHYNKLLVKYPDLPSYYYDESNVKIPLGWILDKICNIKGSRVGDVGSYKEQALVIINYDKASFLDVENFTKNIFDCVKEKTAIEIECEVTKI